MLAPLFSTILTTDNNDFLDRPLSLDRLPDAFELAGGNREEAARMLGIGERTLYRKIKEYGL